MLWQHRIWRNGLNYRRRRILRILVCCGCDFNLKMEISKKRLRFGEFDEIILLREVLSLNPFENPKEWDIIQEHVFLITQKKFMIRTLKDHLERVIKLWLEKIKILKGKSGIEEPHTEKDDLCQNINNDLMERFKKEKRIKKSSFTVEAMAKKQGENDRNKWASMMVNTQPVQSIQNIENNKLGDHDHSYFHGTGQHNAEDVQEEIVLQFDMDAPNELLHKDTEDTENPSNSNMSRTSIPVTPGKEATKASLSVGTAAKSSKVLAPVRSRQRKASVQRQGLAYLQKYDRDQTDLKEKEMKLEERKVALEEQKHTLEQEERARTAALEDRKMALSEYETKKKLELEERKLNLEEQKMKLEMEDKKILKAIVERQEKIINIFLTKNVQF